MRRLKSPRRRGWWTGPLLMAVAAAYLVGPASRGASPNAPQAVPAAEIRARVTEVVDGDTIGVELPDGANEHVRYIGVNTPESTPNQPLECFGHEAAAENERLVGGRRVLLRFGAERRDDYGRLLAYVYLGGRSGTRFVNAELVRGGFARSLTIAPNDARAPLFRRLETRAARLARGLWSACATSFANLSVP